MDEFEKDFEILTKKLEIAFNEYIHLHHNCIADLLENFNSFLVSHPLQEDIDHTKRMMKHKPSEVYVGDTGADLIIGRLKIRLINNYLQNVYRAMEMVDND